MADFDVRTPQPASKKKAKRRQAAPSTTITDPEPSPAPAQSWWDWGTSALSGIAGSVTSIWSTPDPATSRIQPATAHTTPEATPTDGAPPSRIQPTTARTAPDPATTDGAQPSRIQPKQVPPATATATSGGRKKPKRRGKGPATAATVNPVTSDALVTEPPAQPVSEPPVPAVEPQQPATPEPSAPKEPAAPKPESKSQRTARLLAEARERVVAEIGTTLAGAQTVLSHRQQRGLTSQPLNQRITRLTALYRKGQQWHEIETLLTGLRDDPDARPDSIANEEEAAKAHYEKSERRMVDEARRVLELAPAHKVDASKAAAPSQLLAEIDAALRKDPPGYTQARKLGRQLKAALDATNMASDVELAVKCTAEIDDLRRLIRTAETAAADALAPTAPALPPRSLLKFWAETMGKRMQAFETAMTANARDWSTISNHMRDARRAAESVQHEIAIAPKRANDMVGGNDVPLETQKVGELHGDGVAGEVEAVREALRSIHGAPLGPGEQRWTGGGGKWGEDHGNYHPQYGESYGVHSGPLPPLPGGNRYLEYYVRKAPDRGDLRRIVRSEVDSRIWYTWDHYKTFVLLDET